MKIIRQIGLLFGLCVLAQGIEALLPFSFPASVIAMLVLLVCLFTGILKHEHIGDVSSFLLGNMAFFFVPAGVSMISYLDVLMENALALVVICVLTTVITFAATAYAVRFVLHLQARRAQRKGGAA